MVPGMTGCQTEGRLFKNLAPGAPLRVSKDTTNQLHFQSVLWLINSQWNSVENKGAYLDFVGQNQENKSFHRP